MNDMKKKNIKKIILGSFLGVLIGSLLGTTYAMFTYNSSSSNSKLLVGDIYMKYKETNTNINISGMTPTYTLPNDYFEFEITGKNTTTNKDIWYDINIKWGDQETGKTRIRDEFLRFTLKEKIDNGEWTTPIDAKKYSDFQNGLRMWVNKIGKDQTTDTTRTYRLYVWIDGGVKIGNNGQDYTISEWNNLFASVKVDVTGDFIEKEPYQESTTATFDIGPVVNTKLKLLAQNQEYTGQDLSNVILPGSVWVEGFFKSTEIPDISSFSNVNILSSNNSEETIYAWLNQSDDKLYWYSDADVVFLNEDSSNLFCGLVFSFQIDGIENVSIEKVRNMSNMFNGIDAFENDSFIKDWDVSKVTNMSGMFNHSVFLNFNNLKDWNVSNVIDMSNMFLHVFNDDNPIKNASPINNWDVRKVTNFNNMFALIDGSSYVSTPSDYVYPSFTLRPGYWNNSITTIDGKQYYSGTYVPNN